MKGDDTAPATKADLALLKEDLNGLRADFDGLKEDMRLWKAEIQEFVRTEAEATRRYFDVVAERLHHDFLGIFKDRTEQHSDKLHDHERRLTTVERRLGLVI